MAFDDTQSAHLALRDIVGERTRGVVAWVGSGLSVGAGIPVWSQLRNQLREELRLKIESMTEPDRSKRLHDSLAIDSEKNTWRAFGMLQEQMGQTSFRDIVRRALQPPPTAPAPDEYRYLWRLRVEGVLTLNLDRLVARAFAEEGSGVDLLTFSGHQAGRLAYVLNGRRPFVANLHGTTDDAGSWILTERDLRGILSDSSYKIFLQSCLTSKTVLFIGITVDDLAVGGHLEALSSLGVHTSTHYWLTDRCDHATDRWAESANIRVIRYQNADGNHNEVKEFFRDLVAFVPPELPPAPPTVVTTPAAGPDPLPPPNELALKDAEEIRQVLNRQAQFILGTDPIANYDQYEEFCEKYDEAIYRAWYTSTSPGSNNLLGYRLHTDVTQGAFGKVYRAVDMSGEPVAVKVLREDIRNKPAMLKSFRRGVRSMRILQQRSVSGMVEYYHASEIPAFVAMEWVDGPNLADAIHSRDLSGWSDILRVARELTSIIEAAHGLPERVLHRDIRPSNIMLKGFHSRTEPWSVVVLDFDLSWHRGSSEESVVHSTIFGYLAPEQIREIRGASTRHAAVDSFGLGMTFYFMVTGRDPVPNQHRDGDWPEHVNRACRAISSPTWQSLPRRFARAIIEATRHEQSKRLDLSQLIGEFSRLSLAL